MPYLIQLLLFVITFTTDPTYETYISEPSKVSIYWKAKDSRPIANFNKLKQHMPDASYAVNGGMFMEDLTPCGLLVQDGKMLRPLKILKSGKSNFSMQPQGVFAITKQGKAVIVPATEANPKDYTSATQSSPMLVMDGKVNPKLTRSDSKVVRNGVGILPDGRVLFAMSKWKVTFQEFAQFFIDSKCITAMYMDGAVSQTCNYTKELGDPYNALGVFIVSRK